MLNYWLPSVAAPAVTSVLILSLFFLQQGCTTTPWESWTSPVTEETRSKIRSVGIEVSEELPRVTLDLPSKGAVSGAGRKAGKWAGNWAMASIGVAAVGGGADRGLGATTGAGMLAITPVVAGVGALYGAVEAPSTNAVEYKETEVRGVLHADKLIGDLEQQMFGDIRNRTDFVPVLLPRTGGDTAGGAPDTSAKPDARLKITLKSIQLRGAFDVDPPLSLHVETHVTLLNSQNATEMYSRTFHYETGTRQLTDWTADDATLFRKVVHTSLSRLVELIVDDVFLIYAFNHDHPWRKPLSNTTR